MDQIPIESSPGHTLGGSHESLAVSLGLEPLRSLAVAVELIPMRSRMALYMFLRDHPEFPARYMKGSSGVQERMLYLSEIIKIRQMLLIESGDDKYHTPNFLATRVSTGRPRTRARSPIDEIMRRAMVHA